MNLTVYVDVQRTGQSEAYEKPGTPGRGERKWRSGGTGEEKEEEGGRGRRTMRLSSSKGWWQHCYLTGKQSCCCRAHPRHTSPRAHGETVREHANKPVSSVSWKPRYLGGGGSPLLRHWWRRGSETNASQIQSPWGPPRGPSPRGPSPRLNISYLPCEPSVWMPPATRTV